MTTRKSMFSTHPEFIALWHPTKNITTAHDVSAGSYKKVWWQCSLGHEWEAVISNVTRGKSNCPYCSGRKATVGMNDLATTNPLIAQKWHPTKNYNLTPNQVRINSTRKVWWLCAKGHEWNSVISTQTDTSCPYCYGRYVITGENDLATLYPDAVAEWHPSRNGILTPQTTLPYTPKKIWWICKEGHEWEKSPNVRFSKSAYSGCPYCGGNQASSRFQ